jgi:hypothetical protein
MLIKLLRAIKSHPLANIEELARELDTRSNMIEDMVADLSKKGYLKSFADCDSTCDHCPVGSACAGNIRLNVWMLTEKGYLTAEKNQS